MIREKNSWTMLFSDSLLSISLKAMSRRGRMFNFGRYSVNIMPGLSELEVFVDERDPPIWRERKRSLENKEEVYRPRFSRECISDES